MPQDSRFEISDVGSDALVVISDNDRKVPAIYIGSAAEAKSLQVAACRALAIMNDREARAQASVLSKADEAEFMGTAERAMSVFAKIKADPALSGSTPCPKCGADIAWAKSGPKKHVRFICKTAGCLSGIE